MKIARKIIRYIITFLTSISIIMYLLITIASSTILSEEYIISKLEESNYYENILEEVKSNFKKYIYQSGMDEEILENIIAKEKIRKDTMTIINNIYNGTEQQIDVQEIKDNLNKNIEKALGATVMNKQKDQINSFVEVVSDEYLITLSNTGYEKQINDYYNKVNKYIGIIEKALLIMIVVNIILIFVLSIRRKYKAFVFIGIALTTNGMFDIFTNIFVQTKTKVENIILLNDTISIVIRNVLKDILTRIQQYGIITISIGVALIVIPIAIHNIRKYKIEQED